MLESILGLIALTLIGGAFLFYKRLDVIWARLTDIQSVVTKRSDNVSVSVDTQPITAQLQQHTSQIKSELEQLPDDILRTLTGSANTHKGKLGELIGYITLKAEYDKIIPLGTIVDFMAIRFGTESQQGTVDFLDIKTGDNARLNKDQRALKNLIAEKKIRFRTIKIDTIDGMPDDGATSTDTSA